MTIDTQKLHGIYVPHLRGQLEQGQAILFTGAGFSRGVKNILRNSFPGVDDLKQAYWNICYPDSPIEDNVTLQDLYEAALLQHSKDLENVTTRMLTVERESIPDWYQLYFSMPWLRAYTLNIDDLAEAHRVTLIWREDVLLCQPPTDVDKVLNLHARINLKSFI